MFPKFWYWWFLFKKEIYGEKLAHNKTASNTLRLYYAEEDLKDFFKSSQAKFWEKNGHPFVKLSPGEIKEMLPSLDQQNLGNINLIQLLPCNIISWSIFW